MRHLKFRVDNRHEFKRIIDALKLAYPNTNTDRAQSYTSNTQETPVKYLYFNVQEDGGTTISAGRNLACFTSYPAIDLSHFPTIGMVRELADWIQDEIENNAFTFVTYESEDTKEECYKIPPVESVEFVEESLAPEMTDAMIDIETLGNKSGCVILSGAIRLFNLETGDIGKGYTFTINPADSIHAGFHINLGTVQWWTNQGLDAFRMAMSGTDTIKDALDGIEKFFILNCPNLATLRIWGNGQRFDLGILDRYFEYLKRDIPWNGFMERDVRTLVMYGEDIKKKHTSNDKGERTTSHKPLEDCDDQIAYCTEIHQRIKKPAKCQEK